ncbi:MAG: transporter substrate-binding domain-containing protein [Xenococcus sp. MO_188.B8]|nr:transporter substrate-binding domain-containing protein [Xenococcus sp. MO_188.B8]
MASNKIKLLISLVILSLSFTSTPVEAETSKIAERSDTTNSPNLIAQKKKLRVGIAGEPPEVIKSQSAQVSGIIIEYWHELAQTLDLDHELILYSTVEDSLTALADGKIDLALGSISITSERIAKFDFTQSLAREDLTLLLPSSPPTLWSTIKPFLGRAFFSSLGGIFLCIFVVGNLLWLAERNHNGEQFSKSYAEGIREGMWCALTTFSTVGYGDRFPVTSLGRLVAGVWMILSLVVVTSLTAGIATTLAIAFSNQPSEQFSSPSDLKGARVSTVGKGSAQASWAKFYRARVTETEHLSEAINLLANGQVDGVVGPRDDLYYYLLQHPQAPYQLANFNFGTQTYGIALPLNSPLTRKFNELLLQLDIQFRLHEIREDWLKSFDETEENNP